MPFFERMLYTLTVFSTAAPFLPIVVYVTPTSKNEQIAEAMHMMIIK